MEMLRELIYAVAWVAPFILLVFLGIVYVETGGRERIVMIFEGQKLAVMNSIKEVNNSDIRHRIIGPAFQIRAMPRNGEFYHLAFVFKKPRFARRRFKEIEKIVKDYFLEFQEVFGVFDHASVDGKTITIKLWRVTDVPTSRVA